MDSMIKVDLRTVSFDVPPQEVSREGGGRKGEGGRRKAGGRVRE